MLDSRIITVSINRPFEEVLTYLSEPKNFLDWASGLENLQQRDDGQWITKTPQGEMTLRFTPPNGLGIIDHVVVAPTGAEIYVPMRVIPNQAGADMQFTLFRLPEMSDDKFLEDRTWVQKDLNTLKRILEQVS